MSIRVCSITVPNLVLLQNLNNPCRKSAQYSQNTNTEGLFKQNITFWLMMLQDNLRFNRYSNFKVELSYDFGHPHCAVLQ